MITTWSFLILPLRNMPFDFFPPESYSSIHRLNRIFACNSPVKYGHFGMGTIFLSFDLKYRDTTVSISNNNEGINSFTGSPTAIRENTAPSSRRKNLHKPIISVKEILECAKQLFPEFSRHRVSQEIDRVA